MEVIKIKTSQIENSYNKYIDNKTNIYYDIFKRKDIAKFTYYDYLYIERQKTIHCSEIREEEEPYEAVSSNSIHNVHDKTYRNILDNQKYATYIINQALNLTKPIKEEEIEKYTNRYITNEYTDKETDVVYKLKNKDIYFLIEHQSSVDYSMSFRLEEYKLEIMRSAIDKEKVKTKEYEIPTVIPIVLYTGKDKWIVRRTLNKVQDERLENLNLQRYNLIDIGKYNKEDLLNSSNLVDKIFLMEKAQNTDEITKVLPEIGKKLPKDERNYLIKIVRANFMQKIGKEKLEKLIKEMKGEDEDMLGCVEMVWEEALNKGWKEGMNKGKKEGKKEERLKIAIEMKKNNIEVELIEKITGLKKNEIK